MAMSGDIGTCYSQRECTNLMGTASGVCAGNFGVCCVGLCYKDKNKYQIEHKY